MFNNKFILGLSVVSILASPAMCSEEKFDLQPSKKSVGAIQADLEEAKTSLSQLQGIVRAAELEPLKLEIASLEKQLLAASEQEEKAVSNVPLRAYHVVEKEVKALQEILELGPEVVGKREYSSYIAQLSKLEEELKHAPVMLAPEKPQTDSSEASEEEAKVNPTGNIRGAGAIRKEIQAKQELIAFGKNAIGERQFNIIVAEVRKLEQELKTAPEIEEVEEKQAAPKSAWQVGAGRQLKNGEHHETMKDVIEQSKDLERGRKIRAKAKKAHENGREKPAAKVNTPKAEDAGAGDELAKRLAAMRKKNGEGDNGGLK